MLARSHAAEEKAWWRDMVGLVGATDLQLVVIQPRADATVENLRGLGQALATWREEFPQARHIWGLSDLLQGRTPRTPPIAVAVPFPGENYEEAFEPVALVFVTQGTDLAAAAQELYERPSNFHDKLACFDHPETYSHYRR
jgi:hypothetical protein